MFGDLDIGVGTVFHLTDVIGVTPLSAASEHPNEGGSWFDYEVVPKKAGEHSHAVRRILRAGVTRNCCKITRSTLENDGLEPPGGQI